ncbi:40S ribosomal protein mrp10 [Candidozyma auris]|nr:mitochondrial ribosomal protein 10 [[Candida] auris]PIS51356.1 hypothetical protein B9J08_002934 [[Candida] auris]PIS53342.1 hypothetical protein CJI97_003007 [[Candida] auris]
MQPSKNNMAYKKVAQSFQLPPLPHVKVRNPVATNSMKNCTVMMASLLNCWAANGEGSQACAALEYELKTCMEVAGKQKGREGSINYHTSRLYPKLKRNKND